MAPIDDLKEVIEESPASSADELAEKLGISKEEASKLKLKGLEEDLPDEPEKIDTLGSSEEESDEEATEKENFYVKTKKAVRIDPLNVKVHGNQEEDEEEEKGDEFQRRIEEHKSAFEDLQENLKKVIIGQDDVVERVVISLMCDGNILLEGVPGLGKSLLVESLGRSVEGAAYNRIQFVPDMLPSDILGQRVYNQKKGEFRINKGPVFTNFLLADEINRAPPKTQAAMMEVMQEKKVSIEKKDFQLDPPFLVLATQNPVEQKGTYPLPEAIMDRFFMKLELNYPERDDENEILLRNSIRQNDIFDQLEKVLDKEQILQAQEDVRDIHISEDVRNYITKIITTARGKSEKSIEVLQYIDYGPSPRASIWLSLAASAKAMLEGRDFAKPEDVKQSAKPILRHRVQLNYEAKLKDMSKNQVVEAILDHVEPE